MFGLKKKINENEYIIKFKEIWKNKKYRSLVMLGLYFIFFLCLGIVFRTIPSKTPQEQHVHDINETLSNFEESLNNNYQYTITINNKIKLDIDVTNGTSSFIYQNEQYMIINNNIYHSESGNLILIEDFLNTSIPIQYLTLNNIYAKVKNLKPTYNKEIENKFETRYVLDFDDFTTKEVSEDRVEIKVISNDRQIEEFKVQYLLDSYIIKKIEE